MFTGGSESVGSSVTVATVLPRLSITSRSSGENHLITGNVPGAAPGAVRLGFNQSSLAGSLTLVYSTVYTSLVLRFNWDLSKYVSG